LSLEQSPLRNPEDCLAEEAMGAHFQEILFLMNQKNKSEF
jgi:MerR family redox-sensitive transcriptional activator SoxR